MKLLFSNNAISSLANSITAAATTMAVSAGHGARFPQPAAGEGFYLTLFQVQNGIEANHEIVLVTARSIDTLTIQRGQDGTTARAFVAGDQVSLRATAGGMKAMAQLDAPNAFTTAPTFPTAAAGTNDTSAATTAFAMKAASDAAAAVVNASPAQLDTLNELAAALGNDANYAASTTAAIATKQDANKRDASGGFAGLTGFWHNLFNAAGTIKSMIASAATAARTWTMPDKSGTVALMQDVADPIVNTMNGGPLAGFRNKIINGAMQVDQRNNGASFPGPHSVSIDRWSSAQSGTGVSSSQRVTDAPPGFEYSYKRTVTTAVTAAAGDVYQFYTVLEGSDTIDLLFGTAGAKSVTVGFWVKSSIIGKYGCFLYAPLAGSSPTTWRSSVQTYTVNAANTWEYKTLTFIGDTANTLPVGNAFGLALGFDTGSGTNANTATLNTWQAGSYRRTSDCVNFMATANATWQITGVQLEQGAVATPFERRPLSMELTLCQRYYEVGGIELLGTATAAGQYISGMYPYKVTKRATPTMTVTASYLAFSNNPVLLMNRTDAFSVYITSTSASGTVECTGTFTSDAEL